MGLAAEDVGRSRGEAMSAVWAGGFGSGRRVRQKKNG
jgi:hypothetical protein